VLEGVEDAAVHDLPERVCAGRRGGRRRREALAGGVDGGGDEAPDREGGEEAAEGEGSCGEARKYEHGVVVRRVGYGAGSDGKEVGARVELEEAAV